MENIERFLSVDEFSPDYCSGFLDGSGFGSGDGDDYCSGSGYGAGSGDGYCDEFGYGYGGGSGYGGGGYDGSGYGGGTGDGVLEYNHQKVYRIDRIQTIIESVHGNYAKGKILNKDLTVTPCFIAKYGNFFAHGETLKQALSDASDKYNENVPLEKRIEDFNKKYQDDDMPIDGNELFSWHHVLTGSCLFGRKSFCSEHNLDVNAKYTVRQFISLTENAFGGDVIKKLRQSRNL